eukprot:1996268-Amphidinium_carterae.1
MDKVKHFVGACETSEGNMKHNLLIYTDGCLSELTKIMLADQDVASWADRVQTSSRSSEAVSLKSQVMSALHDLESASSKEDAKNITAAVHRASEAMSPEAFKKA